MNAIPANLSFDQGTSALLAQLTDAREAIARRDFALAEITYRILLREPVLPRHPLLQAEALGNLGTALVFRVLNDEPGVDPARALAEAITLLGQARRLQHEAGATTLVFDMNLLLAHRLGFQRMGTTGDLLAANVALGGLPPTSDPWASAVRDLIDETTRSHRRQP